MRILFRQALRFLWIWLAIPTASAEMIREVKETSGYAVQLAIDACATNGGGVVYLPPGRYVSGPLWLKDNVELRLEAGATVVLSPEKADWPAGARALVNSKGARHIAITGRGTFDGNAQWEYAPARGQDPEIVEEREIARRAGVENITVANLRVKMLAENSPDKRATDALVFQGIDGLTLRGVEVDWDREKPEPKWGSALVLRDVSGLLLQDFRGKAARPDGPLPAILKKNVTERHVDP